MNKLNKKLAEWAGFIPIALDGYSPFWKDPDYRNIDGIPNFTESLDACDKWLVPKLFELGLFLSLIIDKRFSRAAILSGRLDRKDKIEAVGENINPALALCLAIEKLIDGEK